MVTIPLGLGDWESSSQDIPRLKLHNMYVTENPSSQDGFSRISRPTLKSFAQIGTGPIRGFWRQETTLDGDWLVASGEELFRMTETGVSTKIGDIPGTGYCQFSGAVSLVLIIREGLLYYTDGTTLTTISVPDNKLVNSVASINSFFLVSIKDEQVFYWLEPNETVIDALNFASAERIPDPIIGIKVVSDEIWFLGKTGPEVWTPTGDLEAPFQRINGRVYNEGCFSVETISEASVNGYPSLFWVTDTKAVVVAQGSPSKVSNESVEELLKTSDNLVSWYFRHNRHDFYVISSDIFTVVYDITTQTWMRWSSYLKSYWTSKTGSKRGSRIFSGDSETNDIWELEEGLSDNGDPVVKEIAGFLPNSGPSVPCSRVELFVNAGWSPSYSLNPLIELRWSEDLGATWSNYVPTNLGERGNYTETVSFRSLGLIKNPGRIFEIRVTDPIRFRLDYATMNERN